MATYEVAQMVAKIGADTTALESRLGEVEKKLTSFEAFTEKVMQATADAGAKAYASTAKSSEDSAETIKKAAYNTAEYEYKIGLKSVEDYRSVLDKRMEDYGAHTNEWRDAARRSAAIEIETQRDVTRELKLELQGRASMAKIEALKMGGEWKQALRDIDKQFYLSKLQTTTPDNKSLLYSSSEQAAASSTLVRITQEEEIEKVAAAKRAEVAVLQSEKNQLDSTVASIKAREAAVANLAKFEYEQGNLSAEAYKVFLQRRMVDFAEYTSEWKAASSQLVIIERAELAERSQADKAYLAQRAADFKAYDAQMVANEREAQALMVSASKEAAAAQAAIFDEKIAAEKAAQASMAMGGGGFGLLVGGLGNVAAAITAVDIASGAMYAGFEKNTQAVANNAMLSKQQLEDLRKETLQLGEDTGAAFNDIANGFMRVENFNASKAWSAAGVNEILRTGTEAAVANNASVNDTTDALAREMHIYNVEAHKAAQEMNLIHQSAAHADATLEDWVNNTGKAVSMAAAFHIKLRDVEAALTGLAQQGFSVAEADTQVRNMITHIANPSKEAQKGIITVEELQKMRDTIKQLSPEAKKLGIDLNFDFSPEGLKAKGLYNVLRDIAIVTHGNEQAVNALIPAMRGGTGAFILMTTAAKGYQAQLEQNTKLEGETNSKVIGYNEMMETSSQKVARLVRTIQADFMPIGAKALDIFVKLTPEIKSTADAVLSLMQAFERLPVPVQETVLALGGLTILAKITGLLTALRIPVQVAASLAGTRTLFLGIGTAIAEATTVGGGFAGAMTVIGAALNPVVLGIGLAVIAIGGLVWWMNKTENAQKDLDDQLQRSVDDHAKAAHAALDNQKALGVLEDRYSTLRSKGNLTHDQIVQIHDTLNQISVLAPDMVEGYDRVGNAIGLVGDKASRSAKQIADMTQKLHDAAIADTKVTDLQRANAASQRDDIQGQIDLVKTELRRGLKLDSLLNAGVLTTPGDYMGIAAHTTEMTNTDRSAMAEQLRQLVSQREALTRTMNSLNTQAVQTFSNAKSGDVGSVPSYVASMLKDVGKQVGRDCGEELTHYLHGKVSAMDTTTNQVRPNEVGNYPEGTIFHVNPDQDRDRYKSGHYWTVHYENGIAHRLESNVVGHDVVSDSRVMSAADVSAATWGGRVHAYKPSDAAIAAIPQGDGKGFGRDDLAQAAAKLKAEHEAAEARKREQARAEAAYDREILRLEKIITLKDKVKSQSLGSSTEADKAQFDLQHTLALANTPAHAKRLEALASKADIAEHNAYVDNIIEKAQGKQQEATSPQWLKDVLTNTGVTMDQWNQFGTVSANNKKGKDGFTEAQDKLITFSQTVQAATLSLKARKAAEDAQLQEYLSHPENKALKGAVEAAGGVDSWKRFGVDPAGTSRTLYGQSLYNDSASKIRSENGKFFRSQDLAINTSRSEYDEAFNKEFDPASFDAGQLAVDKWKKTNIDAIQQVLNFGTLADKMRLLSTYQRIKAEADYQDSHDATKFLLSSQKQLALSTTETGQAQADSYNPIMKAIHAWENANHDAIQKEIRDYGALGQAKIDAYEADLRGQTIRQQTSSLDMSTQQMRDSLQATVANNRNYKTAGDAAVGQWENSPEGQSYITALGLDSQAVLDHTRALKQLTNVEDDMAKAAARRQEFAQGITSGIMGSVSNAFNPNPQQRGEAQTQLYSLQQEQLQYQVAEAQWKSQYPNDPNDPYIQRLKDVQTQIDQTSNKLNSMGNTFTNVFKRLFGGIYDSFKQTLTKMAQEYLQSQLLQYLTRQIGTGSSFTQAGGTSGGGSSSWLGGIIGAVNLGLGLWGGGHSGATVVNDGGALGGGGDPFGAGFADTIPAFAYGTDDVPGPRGAGDIIPARLSPGEMVIPVAKANRIRNGEMGTTNVTNVNNTFKQTVNTPDVQGFRSSKATIYQGARRAFRPSR